MHLLSVGQKISYTRGHDIYTFSGEVEYDSSCIPDILLSVTKMMVDGIVSRVVSLKSGHSHTSSTTPSSNDCPRRAATVG